MENKMEASLGLILVKLFKAVVCTHGHRVGRFNVYQANHKNTNFDKPNGVIRQNEDIFCKQNSDLSGGCCRSPVDRRSSPTGSVASTQSQSQLTPSRQLSDGERLKKVILELIDTEKTYVKHLNNLLENYLEPLRNAPFLSSAEVSALFGNIREIVAFQRLFLQALQEATELEPAFHNFEQPYEFKNVLFSIGSAFLYYASQFKLYSSFCASHSKAQKVLHPSDGNQALQDFLMSRNPRQQHSSTLESYLIKPIQRILKYPLLLQQLKALTEPGSEEHRHLLEALKVMEKVAEHINEMQRIHEEYGAIFDHLFRQHQKSCKQPIDLSPGDLLYYGGVEWLNISDFLGKIKKGLELHAMCFVFKTAVVFLCKERLRQKKKLMGGSGKNSSSEVEIIRYQVLIPVTEVQVRASSMKDMDSHFLWELIHLKSQVQRRSEKVYHLSNSTSEFRNAFLKTIRQIIRESVRNMSIPSNKPGPSSGASGAGGPPGGSGMGGSGRNSTNTLQPSRMAGGKKKQPQSQTASLHRHSAGKIDFDYLESYDNVPETQSRQQTPHHMTKGHGTPQHLKSQQEQQQQEHTPQHSSHYKYSQVISQMNSNQHNSVRTQQQNSHNNSCDSDQGPSSLRTRSKTVSDAMDELSDSTTKSDYLPDEGGARSEGEEDTLEGKKITLGRTPNHLSLSTTSTLSTGSTGSQARLIQASNTPANYQPVKSLGSPIWKPRDDFGSMQSGLGSTTSLSRPPKERERERPRRSSGGCESQTLPRPTSTEPDIIRLPRTNPPPFSYITPESPFSKRFSSSTASNMYSSLLSLNTLGTESDTFASSTQRQMEGLPDNPLDLIPLLEKKVFEESATNTQHRSYLRRKYTSSVRSQSISDAPNNYAYTSHQYEKMSEDNRVNFGGQLSSGGRFSSKYDHYQSNETAKSIYHNRNCNRMTEMEQRKSTSTWNISLECRNGSLRSLTQVPPQPPQRYVGGQERSYGSTMNSIREYPVPHYTNFDIMNRIPQSHATEHNTDSMNDSVRTIDYLLKQLQTFS